MLIVCANFSLTISFNFFFVIVYFIQIVRLFYADVKATEQPRVDGSPNPEFIRENNLKAVSYPVGILDSLFPVYKQKNGGHQKTPSLLSTEELLKCYNEKAIGMGMGDTCYPNFLPFTMDEFERHLYIYYFNGLNPSPRIHMKFISRSAYPVQGDNFLCFLNSKLCEATQGV